MSHFYTTLSSLLKWEILRGRPRKKRNKKKTGSGWHMTYFVLKKFPSISYRKCILSQSWLWFLINYNSKREIYYTPKYFNPPYFLRLSKSEISGLCMPCFVFTYSLFSYVTWVYEGCPFAVPMYKDVLWSATACMPCGMWISSSLIED